MLRCRHVLLHLCFAGLALASRTCFTRSFAIFRIFAVCKLCLGLSAKWCASTFRHGMAEDICTMIFAPLRRAELIAFCLRVLILKSPLPGLGRYGEEHLDFLFRIRFFEHHSVSIEPEPAGSSSFRLPGKEKT